MDGTWRVSPPLSRLENAVGEACYRSAVAIGALYLPGAGRRGAHPHRPRHRRHGRPDPWPAGRKRLSWLLSAAHAPPAADLRWRDAPAHHRGLAPGNTHGSAGIKAVLKRVVRAIRARWPDVTIEIRMDRGGGAGDLRLVRERRHCLHHWPDHQSPPDGAGRSSPPKRSAAQAATGAEKVRLLGEVTYQAEQDHPRRVIVKAEALPRDRTPASWSPRGMIRPRRDWYVERGDGENAIKDLKVACFADRLSCHRFWANQFRLLLHAVAYWLLDTVRRWLSDQHVPRLQLDTLRLRLLKIGGRVYQWRDHVRLRLAASHPGQPLWDHLTAYHRRHE
ncbi:MAG: transposase [Thermomicrobiales bacterium]